MSEKSDWAALVSENIINLTAIGKNLFVLVKDLEERLRTVEATLDSAERAAIRRQERRA